MNFVVYKTLQRAIIIAMNKNSKTYNIPQTAQKLGVHEMTIRYWIRKKWVTPQLDYRNYPVFTDEDIKKIVDWRNTLRKP